MSASLGLYRLQLLDSQTDQIRARLDEIRQTLENNEELLQARQQADNAKADHEQTERALKQAEAEVTKQKSKIEQTETNLYSGNIKNPKELQDLQNEAAALKRHLSTLEDRLLEVMVEEETTMDDYRAVLQRLEAVRTRLTDQNQNLTTEQDYLNKELERLGIERQAALSPLEPGLLAIYNNLRQERRGLAVASLSEGACTACGTTLTPSQQQSARSTTQIYNCPTCERILYEN